MNTTNKKRSGGQILDLPPYNIFYFFYALGGEVKDLSIHYVHKYTVSQHYLVHNNRGVV